MFEQLARHSVLELWRPDSFLVVLLLAQAYRFLVGPLRERHQWGPPATRSQQFRFMAGLFCIFLATGTPLHLVGEEYLMTAHMIGTMLLTLAAPPLMLTGLPDWLQERILGLGGFRAAFRHMTHPVAALLVSTAVLTIWHIPGVYDAALLSTGLHTAQYVTLVAASVVAWWPLVHRLESMPRLTPPGRMAYCFGWLVFQTFLFSPAMVIDEPWFAVYRDAPRLIGLSAVDDQNLGHMLMNLANVLVIGTVFARSFFQWAQQESAADPVGSPAVKL